MGRQCVKAINIIVNLEQNLHIVSNTVIVDNIIIHLLSAYQTPDRQAYMCGLLFLIYK